MPRITRSLAAPVLLAVLLGACGSAVTSAQPTSPPAATTPGATTPVAPDPTGGSLGTIEFGTAMDESTLTITKPASTFKTTSEKIAWVANLSRPAGTTVLTLTLVLVPMPGVERVIVKTDVDGPGPELETVGNSADLAMLLGRKAGTYVMRYLRNSTVLAEGSFTLEP